MIATNAEQFLLYLEKTISWCHERIDINNPKFCFRTKELEELILLHDDEPEYLSLSSEIVAKIITKRNESIGHSGKLPNSGRVLLSAYDYTNHNGLTCEETDGYFDNHDGPPWGTWICEIACMHGLSTSSNYGESWPPNLGSIFGEAGSYETLLASWVPFEFIEYAQRAIEVECCGMLLWADAPYPNSRLAPKYNEVIPAWFQKMHRVNS